MSQATDLTAALLDLSLSRPAEALIRANRLLDAPHDALTGSFAHQAAGIVLRDRGELEAAFRHLRAAVRCAQQVGSDERRTDVEATLAGTLVFAGRTLEGLRRLDAAAATAHGLMLAKVRLRRGHTLRVLGRYDEALADLRLALSGARAHGDTVWEARILQNRSLCHLETGALRKADADATAAEQLFIAVGQNLEAVWARHHRATVAARRGDLPGALRLLAAAAANYDSLGVSEPELTTHRGEVLLAAGLATEALEEAETALATGGSPPVRRAELVLFSAKAALAAGVPQKADEQARTAVALFRSQRRPGWEVRARLLSCQARFLGGERTANLLTTSRNLAERLDMVGDDDAALGHLLVARLAVHRGDDESASTSLAAAARYRRRGSALTRATGWLAVAMQAAGNDREVGLLRACGHGLDALDEHRMVFGSAELRAMATGHGRDLASLAVDAASRRRSPRLMLEWTERSRATSLAEPSVRPAADAAMERDIAALREAAERVEQASRAGTSTTAAQHQRDLWEAAVRERRRHLSGSFGVQPHLDVNSLLTSLGETQLVVLLELHETLHAVTAVNGRVRRHEIGPSADVLREVRFARFALRRAAHRRGADLARIAERLQQAALGRVTRLLDGGPVVVVPPASLQVLPWSLLPALTDTSLAVAPSVLMWMRASEAASRHLGDRRVVLVAGPGLTSKGAEVSQLSSVHPSVTVLGTELGTGAPPATVDSVLTSMSDAWVAHVAAHGTFRSDSPLFSSLRLDDGALFVHDLDRLRRPPRHMVLSACDGGVSAPVGADETLGLVSGLLRVGTAGVFASVVPVNDETAIPFMRSVHEALAHGLSLPEAARVGRREAAGDELTTATAASFTVWGA